MEEPFWLSRLVCAVGLSACGYPPLPPAFLPSNHVDPTLTVSPLGTVTISINTTFDSDTGEITGGITREVGTGIASGIGYFQVPPPSTGGSQLGIFVLHNLTIAPLATL